MPAFSVLSSLGRLAELDALDRSLVVAEFSPDGLILAANANFQSITGYSLAELRGRHHSILLAANDRSSPDYTSFWKTLAAGVFRQGEFRRIGADGQEIWLQASYNPVLGTRGRTIKIVKVAIDVTAAKRRSVDDAAQIAAIHRSHCVAEFSVAGTIIGANKAFLETFGYDLQEVRGRPHSLFLDNKDVLSDAQDTFWRDLADGEHKSGQFKRTGKGGKEIWVEATYNPILDSAGRVGKIVQYATDITDRLLRSVDSTAQIEALNKSQAIATFGFDGTIRSANRNFLAMTGYKLDEILGRDHSLLVEPIHAASREYQEFWADLERGLYQSARFRRLGKGDKEVWIDATYNPIFDHDGRPRKVVVFAIDITSEVHRKPRGAP